MHDLYVYFFFIIGRHVTITNAISFPMNLQYLKQPQMLPLSWLRHTPCVTHYLFIF